MRVTLSGIVMLGRLLHSWKALSAMLVTLSGIEMLVRLLHSRRAECPILVTPSGIVMLVRLLHSRKASAPMRVTGLPSIVSGISSSPVAPLSQSVMATTPPVVVHVRSSKPAARRGNNAQVKTARRAWIAFMMPQPYHTLGGGGSRHRSPPIRVQETGCGARHRLQRCRKQGAGHGRACKGAGSRVRCTG